MHEALINDTVISKRYCFPPMALFSDYRSSGIPRNRNIFYQDPKLFKSQAVVDRYVDILAYTFGLRRADLNVVSRAFIKP